MSQPVDLTPLTEVMARLRDPETGCPWDLQQNHDSLKPYLIEEAFEVLDTLESGDIQGLKGELGDLLLQIVFHARLAEERGDFDMAGVVAAVVDKMVRRHPHVFGDNTAAGNAESHDKQWEAIKDAERGGASRLADVPRGLPALHLAAKMQKRAATLGFEFPSSLEAIHKLVEEVHEFEAEIQAREMERAEEEFGDILFAMVNVGRMLGVRPEFALRGATLRFVERFTHVEANIRQARSQGGNPDLEQMEQWWQEAKRMQRASTETSSNIEEKKP